MSESAALRRGWLRLALIALAVLPFLPSATGDFIEDDVPIIRDRAELRSAAGIPAVFHETYWPRDQPGGLYRPLTLASYALDGGVWGRDPAGAPARFGVHATNLLLSALAALIAFTILRARTRSELAAFAGAALFAAHPVHVEAVSHMVGRADLLMSVLFLAAFLLASRGPAARAAAAVLYLGACLSKEMAVVLPGVLLVDAWLRCGNVRAARLVTQQAVRLAPFALALALFLGLRGFALGAAASPPVRFLMYAPPQYLAFQDPRPLEVGLTMVHALGEVARLLVVPWPLSADYSGFPHATHLTPAVALSALALAAAVAAALFALRRGWSEPGFWLAWLGLTWLPVSNLVFASGIVLAERTLFLPSVAFAGLAAAATDAALQRDRRWLLAPLAAAAAFAALSAARAPVWSDSRALYEETVARGRFSGHVAKTGLVAELLRELGARPDQETLERALGLARASLAERPTATNLRQLAALEELSGDAGAALEHRAELFQVAPADVENRDALLRLLESEIVRSEAAGDVEAALRLTGNGFVVAQRSGDARLVEAWRARIDRAFERFLDEAVASGDREELKRRLGVLAGAFPQHPLLERYRDSPEVTR